LLNLKKDKRLNDYTVILSLLKYFHNESERLKKNCYNYLINQPKENKRILKGDISMIGKVGKAY